MAGWIKMPLGMEVGLGPGDIVLHGGTAPPEKGTAPQLSVCLLLQNGCMYQNTTWYGGRLQPRRHCVRWGPSSPSLKGLNPQFLANVHCGQTAGWTKMPLSMEVGFGLGPDDFVFDGDPASPPPRIKGTAPHPIFVNLTAIKTVLLAETAAVNSVLD